MDGHSPDEFPSGILSKWIIIVEEAHRPAKDPAFSNFLSEGRKFLRKLVLVASDPSLYESICRLVKPPPLEELLARGAGKGGAL